MQTTRQKYTYYLPYWLTDIPSPSIEAAGVGISPFTERPEGEKALKIGLNSIFVLRLSEKNYSTYCRYFQVNLVQEVRTHKVDQLQLWRNKQNCLYISNQTR